MRASLNIMALALILRSLRRIRQMRRKSTHRFIVIWIIASPLFSPHRPSHEKFLTSLGTAQRKQRDNFMSSKERTNIW